MSRLRFAPQARADLRSIREFIARDNPPAAVRWVEMLKEKAGLLAAHPGMGRGRDGLAPGLRGFPVGEYVIFYRAAGDGVEVVRVLHGARDLEELF